MNARTRDTSKPRIVDLNLLPGSLRPARISAAAIAAAAVISLAIVALVPLGIIAHEERGHADRVEAQADSAAMSVRELQQRLGGRRSLQAQLDETNVRLAALREQREAKQDGARSLGGDLGALFSPEVSVPGARITAVTPINRGLRIDGVAPGPLDAVALAAKLTASGGFASARLASFVPGGADGGQFSIEAGR